MNILKIAFQGFLICFSLPTILAQKTPDTLHQKQLKEVRISTQRNTIERLPDISNTYLWSGKKSEVINLQNLDANIAEKTPRQVFAKVPGVFVYDMDGTGNQTNISTRGLDPHRGWEFNIRANGIITNSDMYGYPASHFSLPFEAVGRIELVRGTGALQYGAQFGGMLNYTLKMPDTTRRIAWESIQSIGSFDMMSTYNAVGGKLGRLQYYAYYSKRIAKAYRKNSDSNYDGQGFVLQYAASHRLTLKAQLLRSYYLHRIPGPLTDAMFADDPRQATRSRNYFNPEIYVPSLSAQWQIGPQTRLSWASSAVLGARRSVQFDRPANVADAINPITLTYTQRQVDIDQFNSYNSELRLLHQYEAWGKSATLTAGVQYFNNALNRRQQGRGTTGSDFDLSIDPAIGWGRDLYLRSKNVSFSLENKIDVTRYWSLSPGMRYESGKSKLSGTTNYYDDDKDLPNTIVHRFPLLGINTEYRIKDEQSIYGGISQAYRPVIFKDIIPGNIYEKAGKNLKNAYGYNAEIGWRGMYRAWKWDIGAFTLQYNNRMGALAQYDTEIDTFVLYRTNIGNSHTRGLEIFVERNWYLTNTWSISTFTSTSYFDARYLGDSVRINGFQNASIESKRVEGVPTWITRNGFTLRHSGLSMSFLYSYTGASFADPLNTVLPSASGTVGQVPAYGLLDCNTTYRVRNVTLRFSINNMLNKQYFTKRPTFYPGPGIWPSDGRSVNIAVGIKL
jgi:Fe(3+) dicitrate transport protein